MQQHRKRTLDEQLDLFQERICSALKHNVVSGVAYKRKDPTLKDSRQQ
jgi:hypothetical protein